jgi:hypothetical protein
MKITEQLGSSCKASVLYPGGARFESCPGHGLSCPKIFVFFLSLVVQCRDNTSKYASTRFLPHPSRLLYVDCSTFDALQSEMHIKESKAIPITGREGQIGLWEVEAPKFSRQSAHRWRWGCQAYTPAPLYTPGRFLVLISLRGWVKPRP